MLASSALRRFVIPLLALLVATSASAQKKNARLELDKELVAVAEPARAAFLTFKTLRAGLAADDFITFRGFYLSIDGLAIAPLQAFDSGQFTVTNEADGSEVKIAGVVAVEPDYGIALIRTDQKNVKFLKFAQKDPAVDDYVAILRSPQNGGTLTAPILARRKAPLPRAQKYLEILSVGVNLGQNGILHVPAGTPIIDDKGQVGGCLYQPAINARQRFQLVAPASVIIKKIPADSSKAATIPFPLPAAFQPADPLSLDASYLLGRDAQIGGQVVQAERLLRRALAKEPMSAVGWQRLGLVLRARNKNEDAMAAFKKAATFGNNLGSFILNQADQLSLMGKIDEATRLLAQACINTPDDYDLHRAYAVALSAKKDEKAAEKQLVIATTLAPDSLNCWALLSKCRARQGKWDEEKIASDHIHKLESLYRPR